MRFKQCGCVDILEVEFVDCLLPSCRQSICHPEDCQGILCPCTINLGPRVLLVKPPVNRRCDKCEKLQSILPPPTKVHRSRHKRDTRERHPARQPCEVIYEAPRALKSSRTTKSRTKDVDRPKAKDTRRPLGVSNGEPIPTASPVAIQTPATAPSMRPSLLPPRPSNPHPPSSTNSHASSGTRPPTSKATPIPNPAPPAPPSTPSSVFSLPIVPDPSTRPVSYRTSSTLSSLGSIAKTGTTRYPLPEIPWPSTAAQTPRELSSVSDAFYAPLDPLGPPPEVLTNSPHISTSTRSWRTATKSTTESRPPSVPQSPVDSQNRSERASSRTWSWKRTGLSRPIDGSMPLQPLPFPPTPAPPPSERRSSLTSMSPRPRVAAAPFISQPTKPTYLSPHPRSSMKSSSSGGFPPSPSPHPKRPILGWTASTLKAVLPKVPSRSFASSTSNHDASPVLVERPITPPPPEIPTQLQPRPRRSFLRPWKQKSASPARG